jgi:isoquinoline 1-oxidoreductase alpha subunit
MISLNVNGKTVDVDVPESTPLLWVLREELGLTGSKFGCGKGLCGACTVHVGGSPVRSCSFPVAGVAGMPVTTIEGISEQGLHAVQRAWIKHGVPQCGYCQSGQIMQAVGHLQNAKGPMTPDEVTAGVDGNLCRCGTYEKIKAALLDAAKELGMVR